MKFNIATSVIYLAARALGFKCQQWTQQTTVLRCVTAFQKEISETFIEFAVGSKKWITTTTITNGNDIPKSC